MLVGSDIFFALNEMRTDDLGKTWSGPIEHSVTLGRREEPNGMVVAASDFWPKWHAESGKLLGIGPTVRYQNLTIRHDQRAYVTTSADGLTFASCHADLVVGIPHPLPLAMRVSDSRSADGIANPRPRLAFAAR